MTPDLILVAVSLFAWGVGEGLFVYFQPLYLQEFGASPIQIGTIIGGMGIAMALTQIPVGYLGDRLGRRPFMWASWIIGTASAWVMATARTLPLFVIGLLLYGLTSFVMAPMNSYITHARGKLSVGRALTFASAAYNLGAVAGPVIGGRLADLYGLRLLYVIAACIFIISSVIILFIKKQPVEKEIETRQKTSHLGNTRFVTLMVVLFITMFSMYLPQPLASNFLQNERGLTFGSIGILGSVGSLGNAILALVLGAINAKVGFIIGQLAVIGFSLAIWLGRGIPWYLIGYFMLGGYRVSKSLSMALTRPLINGSQMGVAYGLIETIASSAIILSPLAAGYLYSRDPELVYPISAVLIGISFILALRFIPRELAKHTEIMITPERGLD